MRLRHSLLATVLGIGLVLPMTLPAAADAAPNFNTTGINLGSGVTAYTEQELMQQGAKENCLAAITKWRQDALNDTKVKWGSNHQTMRQYLQTHNISEADYLAPKWSLDLERIAVIRAVESAVHGQIAHKRLNGESNFNIKLKRIFYNNEVIAWGNGTCAGAIDNWATEKADLVGNTGGVTGHYEYLINPSEKSYGIAGINGGANTNLIYSPVWAGVASGKSLAPETSLDLSGVRTFPAVIEAENAKKATLKKSTIKVGETLTPELVANVYNNKIFYRGTWTSSDPETAAVQTDGSILGKKAGTVNLTLTTPAGDLLKRELTVQDAVITSVAALDAVTTASGTAPALPSTVNATLDNGKTAAMDITWDALNADQYSAREGGTFTATGHIDGWDKPIEVTVNVTAATVTAVNPETVDVTTASGTAPVLPETIEVTWSNGEKTNETATWNITKDQYSAREGGTFDTTTTVAGREVTAHVTVTAATITKITNPADLSTVVGKPVTLPETVKATWSNGDVTDEPVTWSGVTDDSYNTVGTVNATGAVTGTDKTASLTINVAEASITSVAALDAVSTASGTAPTLPPTVNATLDNGKTKAMDITWDAVTADQYSAREGGTFTATGHIAGWDKPIQVTVNVTAATVTAVNPETVDVTTASGTAPVLPETIEVTWSNGEKTNETANWNITKDQYSAREGGTFDATTTVAGREVTAHVTVTAATITKITNPADMTAIVGKPAKLPETVKATWSNGDVTDQPVTWSGVTDDSYNTAGTVNATGAVTGTDKTAALTINVVDAKIVSVAALDAVTTPSGTAPTLPTSVEAIFNNDTTAAMNITWDAVAANLYSARKGGTFTATGHIDGWDKPIEVTVNVTAATATAVTPETIDVTTASGTAPVLPETIEVTWSNGEKTNETANWNITKDQYSAREGGTFDTTATIGGKPVVAHVTVTPATITEVADAKALTTAVGKPVTLPDTVKATWSNGDVTDEAVTWKPVNEDAYNTVGTIKTTGTVTGTDKTVSLTINVVEKKETPKTPKTPEKTTEIKKSPGLAKTGVEFTFMAGVFVLLLLGAGISIRKYASLKK